MIASWMCLAVWAASFFVPNALFEVGILALIACAALRSTLRHSAWHMLSGASRLTLVAFIAGIATFTLARALEVLPSQIEVIGTLLVRVAIIPFAALA
jgi:hypothetical protein